MYVLPAKRVPVTKVISSNGNYRVNCQTVWADLDIISVQLTRHGIGSKERTMFRLVDYVEKGPSTEPWGRLWGAGTRADLENSWTTQASGRRGMNEACQNTDYKPDWCCCIIHRHILCVMLPSGCSVVFEMEKMKNCQLFLFAYFYLQPCLLIIRNK